MGLFSTKKKVYVASSAYNLAGDAALRPQKIFEAMVLSAALRNNRDGMGQSIRAGLMSSTAIHQQRFFGWAKRTSYIGNMSGQIRSEQVLDGDVVRQALAPLLSLAPGDVLEVTAAIVDSADESYWAEAWVAANRPLDLDVTYTPRYLETSQTIQIEFGPEDAVSFAAPPDFLWAIENRDRRVLYANYVVHSQDPVSKLMLTSQEQMFTYRMGSGNAGFDALLQGEVSQTQDPEFYPVIPIRLYNKPVSDHAAYEAFRKAYKRLTRGDIVDLFHQLEENPDIEDVDHCFLVMGVSINTQDNSARRYLYEFLRELALIEDRASYAQIRSAGAEVYRRGKEWDRWLAANEAAAVQTTHPVLYEEWETPPAAPVPPAHNEFKIACAGVPEVDFRLRWLTANEFQRYGNAGVIYGQGELSVGEVLILNEDLVTPETGNFAGTVFADVLRGTTVLCHQLTRFTYRELVIEGLEHANRVYKSKSVVISAKEALEDEDESGFIIPLHGPTLIKLGLRHKMQLASASTYLVFNSYKVQKIKWWQRGVFKVILIIAAVAIGAVLTGGAGLAAAGGLLGNNLALGIALGATGTMAAIAGAVANAIAAAVLVNFTTIAAKEVFGEKWGAIIGAVASFVGMTMAANFAATGSWSVDWSQILNISNLQGLTNSLANGYSQFLAADTTDIYNQITELGEDYAEQAKEIREHSQEILGMTANAFDPMILTDAGEHFNEPRDVFLSRTLLTGSDLAALSHALIEDFAGISLELPLVSA